MIPDNDLLLREASSVAVEFIPFPQCAIVLLALGLTHREVHRQPPIFPFPAEATTA